MPPVVSVIIVTWNSKAHLSVCLQKLSTQTIQDFEVVVIDNGSQDDAVDTIQADFPALDIRIEKLDSNRGFSAANNIGAKLACGKWIALLNADAYPEPGWLEALLGAAEQNPNCRGFSSRQIQHHAPRLLDGAGDAYHISGLAWRNGYNLPIETYGLEQKDIFSPCGAASLYLRAEFLRLGGFDEDYFSYFEDVDLGFRIRLQGGTCMYVPDAVVYHIGSASTGKRGDFSVYYGYRNLIWTFIKDMPSALLFLFLPLHIFTILFFVIYLTLRGQGGVISRAIFDAVRGLPKVIEKRKDIQTNKKIKPGRLLKAMSTGVYAPYREFMKRNKNK